MSIEVAVRVNEQGQLQIPDEIQQQLFPGMVVVLKLEEQAHANGGTNGHAEPILAAHIATVADSEPVLVEKNGWMVIRGELPSEFDWNKFLTEERDNRLDFLSEWARQ